MRAVIYARYSSEHQREASIDDQLRICKERIAREGWTLLQVFRDAAISGASALRPAYQALMMAARDGEFDVVVAEALDRLSRDQEDIAALFKRLQFAGIDVKLGACRVFRCQALADRHRDAGAEQCGRGNRDLPPPQQLDQIKHAEATRSRHCGGPAIRFGLIYRHVIDQHRPQLPSGLPHTSAEGLLFALRHTRRTSTRQKRNREN